MKHYRHQLTRHFGIFALFAAGGALPVRAEVVLPRLISDHMVLQRHMRVTVWGKADPGEAVRVSLRNQEVSTTTEPDGRWRVYLEPMEAGGPFDLTISGKNKITLQDVLVGEVWVCSGQSNMQLTLAGAANAEEEISAANFPQMRLFTVERKVAEEPVDDVGGQWSATTPETARDFSGVGYFFGRDLHHNLNVPVGLINSSWGGTPAESWTSRTVLETDLSFQPILWNWQRVLAEYPGAKRRYDRQVAVWEQEATKAKAENRAEPPKPALPRGLGHPWTPSGLFNGMIAPLTSYAIRGAIWYQGESNAQPHRSIEYRRLFSEMIQSWRRAWDQGPFPFLFVQLANFMQRRSEPSESAWAELREAQMMALAVPNTGMAVTIDIGEADDIHPKNKQDVGHRLALAARTVAYGEETAYSGPLYRSMKIKGSEICLYFDHAADGLIIRNGSVLKGFAIAGPDRRFVWADARMAGNMVVVSSTEVKSPVAVRYAWADNPECNLYGKSGLPASPFRTDNWSCPLASYE